MVSTQLLNQKSEVARNFQHVHWCIPDQPLPAYIIVYLGFLKNKNETAERNATSVLDKKILEMEEKRPKQDKYLGKKYPYPASVMTHDFSSSWIKFFVQTVQRLLDANPWTIQYEAD